MKRERTMLEVIVDLDPMPGTMHTAESAVQSVQAVLLGAMGHYNPVAMPASPADAEHARAAAARQLGEALAERDDLAETLRLRSEALNRVAAELDEHRRKAETYAALRPKREQEAARLRQRALDAEAKVARVEALAADLESGGGASGDWDTYSAAEAIREALADPQETGDSVPVPTPGLYGAEWWAGRGQ